jgi:hypothetical protein
LSARVAARNEVRRAMRKAPHSQEFSATPLSIIVEAAPSRSGSPPVVFRLSMAYSATPLGLPFSAFHDKYEVRDVVPRVMNAD